MMQVHHLADSTISVSFLPCRHRKGKAAKASGNNRTAKGYSSFSKLFYVKVKKKKTLSF